VRFVVELGVGADDARVRGTVGLEGQPSQPFTGWLELLRLLEDDIAAARDLVSGDPAQEATCEG
jgi:hypothetical protein